MSIGVCYFPEHWSRDRLEADVEQMADAGLEYVRMGEFAWSRLEPEPGEYDLDWLEEAVSVIGDHGMQAVLCTPTATPPKWLVDEHPAILQEEQDGTTRHYGGRRHYCFNSEVYRRETRRIVEELADRFADDPNVAGWQTDNEFGCHGTIRCYCDDCGSAFRQWLRGRYDDVEDLNESWGNAFWSQELDSFAQVDPPRHTAAGHHPARLLDYYRFASDSVVEYNSLQADLLREANDDWFVTHNFMANFDSLDAFAVSEDLEFASWDSYPTGHIQVQRDEVSRDEFRAGSPDQVGLNHDLYRSAADAPLWVMEQQPGDINWPPYSPQPAEGAMRLWAHFATAHGANVVSYFRWRRCRMGQEQYHAGLLNQDGSPDDGYHDAKQAAADLSELDESGASGGVPGSALDHVTGDVALLHDYENLWALEIEPNSPDFDYWAHLETYYTALREQSVTTDIVPPESDLDSYDAVVAPTLYLADEELAAHLRAYVETGGELLLTMRSGVKDRFNKLHDALQPGPFADLVGAEVESHESVPEALESKVSYGESRYGAKVWNEWLTPHAADVEARYIGELADGHAAIVSNEVGDGSVTYVGVWPKADLAGSLVEDLLDRADVDRTQALPNHVRFVERGDTTWIANFGEDPVSVRAPAEVEWLLGESTVEGFDVAVTDASPSDLAVEQN